LKLESEKSLTQYNYVYKKTLDALSGTYSRLAEFKEKVAIYTSYRGDMGEEREENRKHVATALSEFQDFIRPRRIFLSPELLAQIKHLTDSLRKASITFMVFIEKADEGGMSKFDNFDKWKEVNNLLSQEVPPIMEGLEKEFRKLMGLNEC